MRIPAETLATLSPAASKIYLALANLVDPKSPVALATAPIPTLIALTHLSDRTCTRALTQLKSAKLLAPLPRRYHKPSTYILPTCFPTRSTTPKTNPPPVASVTPNPPPVADVSPQKNSSPPQTPPITPHSRTKTPMPPQVADLLNQTTPATHGGSLSPSDPIQQILSQIAAAKAAIARLEQKSPPTPHSPAMV